MKKSLLASVFVVLMLLAIAVVSVGAGMAQSDGPFHDPRPSPTPDGLAPAAPPDSPDVPPMSDLVVTNIRVLPSMPRINEEVTIRVTIKNQGPVDVPIDPPQNFYTDLYVDPSIVPIQLFQDGVYAWGCQAYWLPSGASYTLETTYIFTDVKTYVLYAQVDTDAQVPEQNENNNVLGPVAIQVVAPSKIVHETHEDFQMGVASGLDISHPYGVIKRGIFLEPYTEPEVYYPDGQIDNPPAVPSHPNNVNQVKPAITGNGSGVLYAVWEDGRNGGVFNRDIYFASSTNGGQTWSTPDVRINDDPIANTVNQVSPDIAYDRSLNRLYVVWQDGRNGDYDIYFAYYDIAADTWSTNQRLSIDPPTSPTANQLNPSIAVGNAQASGAPDRVYVVWQDRRNGNDDIYLARSNDGGLSWNPLNNPGLPPDNYYVHDDVGPTEQNEVAPSVDVDGVGQVFVAWEDWRVPDHPEVYVTWSWDEGVTFGIDVPMSMPAGESYRVDPSLVVSTTIEEVEYVDPQTGFSYTLDVPITAIHMAWQEGQDEEADIYWALLSTITTSQMPVRKSGGRETFAFSRLRRSAGL